MSSTAMAAEEAWAMFGSSVASSSMCTFSELKCVCSIFVSIVAPQFGDVMSFSCLLHVPTVTIVPQADMPVVATSCLKDFMMRVEMVL